MQRITISLDEALAGMLDDYVAASGYQSRSEGVRDAVERWRGERRDSPESVAVLSYIYDRGARSLAERLSKMQHANHHLVLSVMQTPLDHAHSLVSVIHSGWTEAVRDFADRVRAVSFAALNMTGVAPAEDHADPHDHSHPGHAHLSPTVLRGV